MLVALAQDHTRTYWISDVPNVAQTVGNQEYCETGFGAGFSPCFTDAALPAETCEPALSACELMESGDLAYGPPSRREL